MIRHQGRDLLVCEHSLRYETFTRIVYADDRLACSHREPQEPETLRTGLVIVCVRVTPGYLSGKAVLEPHAGA